MECYTKEDIKDIYEPKPSIGGTGISIFLNNKHYILTSGHVATDYLSANGDTFYGCEVRFSDGIVYYASGADLFNLKTSRADKFPVDGLDIALLTLGDKPKDKTIGAQPKVLPGTIFPDIFKILGQSCGNDYPIREAKEGEKHYVFSFPTASTGYRAIINEGITSGRVGADSVSDLIGIHVPFVTSASLDFGSSGGAVVGEDGCLLGVVASVQLGKLSYLSNFISSLDIFNFIQNAQSKPESTLFSRIRNYKKFADYYKIQDAIDSFLANMGENKSYPQSLAELVPKYLPSLPKDILTGKDYPYAVTKDRKHIHIGVSLEGAGLLLGPDLVDGNLLDKDSDYNSKNNPEFENGFDGSDDRGCLDEQNPSFNPNIAGVWSNGSGLTCFDQTFGIRGKNDCPDTAESYRGTNDPKTCYCSPFIASYGGGNIWGGNGPYTDDSNICRAAVHAGVITKSGGNVTFIPTAGCNSYLGVTQNGITSTSWDAWQGSYYFEGQPSSCSKQTQSDLLSKDIVANIYSAIDVWTSFLKKFGINISNP